MKNFFLGFLLLGAAAGVSSCKDSAKIPAPAQEDLPLIFPSFLPGDKETSFLKTSTTIKSIEALELAGQQRPTVTFEIDPTERDIKIKTLEVYKSYGRGSNKVFVYTPRVKLAEYSSFPVKATFTSSQLLEGLTFGAPNGYTLLVPVAADGTVPRRAVYNNFTPNSKILITFEYVLEDGRRIVLTPLDRNGVVTGTFANEPYALQIATGETYDTILR